MKEALIPVLPHCSISQFRIFPWIRTLKVQPRLGQSVIFIAGRPGVLHVLRVADLSAVIRERAGMPVCRKSRVWTGGLQEIPDRLLD